MNPTRHGPEFSIGATLSINNLPRRVTPSCFTRSNSDARVRRRVFGNEKEFAGAMSMPKPLLHGQQIMLCLCRNRTTEVFSRVCREKRLRKGKRRLGI